MKDDPPLCGRLITHHSSLITRKPFLGFRSGARRETPNFGGEEMASDALCDLADARIRDERDAMDLAVMVSHESEMAQHAGEILPARELLDLDHHARQRAL